MLQTTKERAAESRTQFDEEYEERVQAILDTISNYKETRSGFGEKTSMAN